MLDAHAARLAQLASRECTCLALRRTARLVTRLYEDALRPVRLSAPQCSLLVAMGVTGGMALTPLARSLGLDRTTLYRALRPLMRRGAVRLRKGPARAEKLAELTPAGARLLAAAMPRWREAQEAVERLVVADRLAAMRRDLESLAAAVGAPKRSPGTITTQRRRS
jgi:DNA-binding MarR family transcriptional regulator